ncbi:hypothetical protein BDR04DRAFT_1072251 [Suillus decipiens]|nr:hypothetical protein BDR04DRAFT_1072251 [Suillus decipiens]
MPTLGLSVHMNKECAEACKVDLQNGYRSNRCWATTKWCSRENFISEDVSSGSSWTFVSHLSGSKVFHNDLTCDGMMGVLEDRSRTLDLATCYNLYLIHSAVGGKDACLATYKVLLDGKANGMIKSVGVSNYSAKHIEVIREEAETVPSYIRQHKPTVEYCRKNNIVVQAYS